MEEDTTTKERKYKVLSICEYNKRITLLRKEKVEHMKKVEEIQCEIKKMENRKQEFCKSSLGGHTYRTVIEEGPYGERYRVCISCGIEV